MAQHNPDAALIQACDKYIAAEMQLRSFDTGGANEISDDRARDAARKPLLKRQAALMESIADLRATTPAGVLARVRAADAWGDYAGEYEGEAAEILSYMIRDLLGDTQTALLRRPRYAAAA